MASMSDSLRELTQVKQGESMRDTLTAARINAVQDILRGLVKGDNIQSGLNVKKRSVGGGVMLSSNAAGGAAAPAGNGPYPFDVSFAPLGAGTVTASIRPGSINSLIPSNYLTTYALTVATDYYVVLTATVTSGAVTASTLDMPTSAPGGMPVTVATPPTSFEVLLGVVLGGVWYRVIGDGSLQATSTIAFQTTRSSPVPGTSYYDFYYTWALANI